VPGNPDRTLGWSELVGMGAVIAAQLVAGLALGWLVDSLADTGPVFLLVGLFLGIAAAVIYTIVAFRKFLHS
jgi:F0F1-type ATP synthase assembly protein I